jgi:hypothetical protein
VYRDLAARPSTSGGWSVPARRALRLALALGATISFLNGGHLGPARLLPSMICWSFVPLGRMAAFALAATVLADVPTPRSADLYGAGQGPWLVWLLGVSLVALLRPSWALGVSDPLVLASLALTVVWSLRIRYVFLRAVLGLSTGRASAALALMSVFFWTGVLGFFVGTDQLLPRLIGRG